MKDIRARIARMLEQYSITKDNPTVLRELLKLSAIVECLIEYIENLDPKDFSKEIAALDQRVTKLEGDMAKVDPDAIARQIADITEKASDALTAANEAKAEAGAASSKASTAITTANQASTEAGVAKRTADSAIQRASSAETEIDRVKLEKQDKLTFDDMPKENSQNPVTSDGIYRAIQAGGGSIVLDDNVTSDSQNGVKSSGIYAYGQVIKTGLEQSISDVDGKIDTAKTELQDGIDAASNSASEASTKAGQALTIAEGKQDKLTFDASPKENSQNPVTSDGIYKAIQAGGGGTTILDDTVTSDSSNGVKSSGIYTYGQGIKAGLEQSISNTNAIVSSHTDDIAALQEFQQTQEVTNETHNTQIAANQKDISDIMGYVASIQADKQEKITSGGSDILTELITDLSAAPANNQSMASALAIYNAIQNSGGGGGSANIKWTQRRINVTKAGSSFSPYYTGNIPENFEPMFIYISSNINSYVLNMLVPFSGAQYNGTSTPGSSGMPNAQVYPAYKGSISDFILMFGESALQTWRNTETNEIRFEVPSLREIRANAEGGFTLTANKKPEDFNSVVLFGLLIS